MQFAFFAQLRSITSFHSLLLRVKTSSIDLVKERFTRHILCYAMLCYAVPCHAARCVTLSGKAPYVVYYAMQCCAMLCWALLC